MTLAAHEQALVMEAYRLLPLAVRGYASLLPSARWDADEALQALTLVFISRLQGPSPYTPTKGSLKSYLFMLARSVLTNTARNVRRRAEIQGSIEAEVGATGVGLWPGWLETVVAQPGRKRRQARQLVLLRARRQRRTKPTTKRRRAHVQAEQLTLAWPEPSGFPDQARKRIGSPPLGENTRAGQKPKRAGG